jgi:hypothetical protein
MNDVLWIALVLFLILITFGLIRLCTNTEAKR